MKTLTPPGITHWCRSCKTHHTYQQVRHCIPNPTPFEEEIEWLLCPYCSSHDIDELLDVSESQAFLEPSTESRHCSVVFRLPGTHEAMRRFVYELGILFPGDQAEVIAFRVGNALADQETGL
ncbi:hypothetical protein [Pseudomonas rhodesiae]|uniref:hypothetical protein n=1 Tax=Pseudomonas rhodesiae TaxID=76760 RepID=UPI0028AD7395|nr:hypothetical protein [Pseudomonas rhodesiae]